MSAAMLRLRIEKDGKCISQPVLQSGEHVIGRDPDCDLRLDHPGVSRQHARLVYTNGRLHVIDLGGRNGTFVNGNRVQQSELTPGDELQIAAYTLAFAEGGKNRPSKSASVDAKSDVSKRSHLRYALSVVLVMVAGISFYALSIGQDDRRNHGASAALDVKESAPASVPPDIPHLPAPKLAKQDKIPEPITPAKEVRTKPTPSPDFRKPSRISPEPKPGNSGQAALKSEKAVTPAKREPAEKLLPKPVTQTGNAGQASSQQVTPAPNRTVDTTSLRESEKPTLTPEQQHEAQRLYWQAYQIMQYKNKSALMQALVLLKKAQEAAPDKQYEYYIKAQGKIDLLTNDLTALGN